MCCNVKGCCGNGCRCGSSKAGKALVIIGGLNWGLVGAGALFGGPLADWNVVHMILGSWPTVEAIVYVLVGIAAVMQIFGCRCKKCSGGVCAVHGADKSGPAAGGTAPQA